MNDFQEPAIAIWLRTSFTMWTLTLLYLRTALLRFNHPQWWQILIGRYKHMSMCLLQMASNFLVITLIASNPKFSNVDYAPRASKVFVLSMFLNNIPLYQSIPKSKWNVKCLKAIFMTSIYFLSNGKIITNWQQFLKLT